MKHLQYERKKALVVLDFDGYLVNSYRIIDQAFRKFGLSVGDEERFRNRRKFLKYLGGGREILGNLVSYSLPKQQTIRELLTEEFMEEGEVYPEFAPLLNAMIADPAVHVGILSRNFTLRPGRTIRAVLSNSDVDHAGLDFVIPIPARAKKDEVLDAMYSARYAVKLFGGDEIGDYKAASKTYYESIIGSYGFDQHNRLVEKGGVPPDCIAASPAEVVERFEEELSAVGIRYDLPKVTSRDCHRPEPTTRAHAGPDQPIEGIPASVLW